MFEKRQKCDECGKVRKCEEITGLCEPCWNAISEQNAQVTAGPMPQAVLVEVAQRLAIA